MAIVPNYLKLTLNYLHVLTITPTYTQRYILKRYIVLGFVLIKHG
ncbi:hypothetical protein HPHPH29_0196 [Helicobacter pylori Hp H-29]|nr:hypothetical protein HPHPH29_0196 [Helicobacter pylori Hp H-29]